MGLSKHGLTRHARGWVKKINGRTRWVCSLKAAPTIEQADKIYEERFAELWQDAPPNVAAVATTIPLSDLAELYAARPAFATLTDKSQDEVDDAVQTLLDTAGNVQVSQLGPGHFAKFRANIDARFGVDRTAKYVTIVRSLFKWAAKPPLRIPPPDYGEAMNRPSRREFRLARKAKRDEHGDPVFTTAEIRKQLRHAKPSVKAMVMLALNAGFGNTDVATLPLIVARKAIDTGWIDYARPKTGADRRAWLWPKTVEAITEYLKVRPECDLNLLFVTRRGRPYIEGTKDQVGIRYTVLLKSKTVNQYREGRSFYSLRRTFRTIAAEVVDEMAVSVVMGHAPDPADMARLYTVRVSDQRLRRVSEHVMRWVFPRS